MATMPSTRRSRRPTLQPPDCAETVQREIIRRPHPRAALRAIAQAYHQSETTWRVGDTEYRRRGALQLALEGGVVVAVSTVESGAADGDSPVLGPPETSHGGRRSHGGGGTRLPTTQRELFAVLRRRYPDVEITQANGGHYSVRVPGNPTTVVLAATASDWRWIQNAVRDLRKHGIDGARF